MKVRHLRPLPLSPFGLSKRSGSRESVFRNAVDVARAFIKMSTTTQNSDNRMTVLYRESTALIKYVIKYCLIKYALTSEGNRQDKEEDTEE
ncbi:hypothetical protein RvY_01313 [Ramazzottius varieornatus]|uniref:Uncharacterized protein n=1 Tax=Ramazzottius varieornatus TaxID=947166 RepID=A0A1D1ULZ3_RAMVA|nr:hypothetical protein RvY_01313 [Ramazzottius varieornatus]